MTSEHSRVRHSRRPGGAIAEHGEKEARGKRVHPKQNKCE
jgi:hypothetical protein